MGACPAGQADFFAALTITDGANGCLPADKRNPPLRYGLHYQFTVTARMERARLPGVDAQMAGEGYTRRVIAERLDKEQAETLRDKVRDEWTAKGYAYQTRPQLS